MDLRDFLGGFFIFFRSKPLLLSSWYWEEKKSSESFGQMTIFVQWVLERKKFQNFLVKTDAHDRWEVRSKNFRIL